MSSSVTQPLTQLTPQLKFRRRGGSVTQPLTKGLCLGATAVTAPDANEVLSQNLGREGPSCRKLRRSAAAKPLRSDADAENGSAPQ